MSPRALHIEFCRSYIDWYFKLYGAKSLQLCLTLWDPVDCSLPGSSVHGIFQARIVKSVVIRILNLPNCQHFEKLAFMIYSCCHYPSSNAQQFKSDSVDSFLIFLSNIYYVTDIWDGERVITSFYFFKELNYLF